MNNNEVDNAIDLFKDIYGIVEKFNGDSNASWNLSMDLLHYILERDVNNT